MINYQDKLDYNLLNTISILNEDEPTYIDCIIYVNNYNLSKQFFQEYKPSILKIIHEYPFINAFGVRIKVANLTRLAQLSQIVYISSKTEVYAQVCKAKEVLNLQNLTNSQLSGKGINIAVLDTGIAPHLDFLIPTKRIKYFKDFINNKNIPYDDNGHGTMVSGIIAGNGIKSQGKNKGIACNSNIISLKCLNNNGQTTTMEMLNAMQWVYDNKAKYNIDIVCMSFGATPLSQNDPLIKGAEILWNEGVIVVAAAGNSGPDYHTIKSPGSSGKIITVGSLDDGRKYMEDFYFNEEKLSIPDFSSRGPTFGLYKPDLLASGVDILSTSKDLGYTTMSGTSVSTPIIAGVCALIMEKYNRSLTPNQIKEFLLQNCHSLNLDRNTEGFGYLRF